MVPDPLRRPPVRHGLLLLLGLTLGICALEAWLGARQPNAVIAGYFWLPLLLVPWLGRTADLLPLALTDLLLTLWSVIQASDPALQAWFEQTPLRAAVFLLVLWLNQVRFRHDESLKLLEAIETGSPVGLALVEYPGGRILRLNPAMAVLLGGPPEAMLDRTWWDFGSSLVPGGPPQRQQLRTCRFQMRWVELAVHDLMASEGGRRLMVVQALDCQQAAEAEAALASQAEELRRQLAVSLEACTLSHEIRQPLSLLQLQSRQLLQRLERGGIEPAALRAELTAVAGTAEQINSTIVSMLSLLRSGTAIQEPLDLAAVVRAAITALRPRLEAAGVRCSLEGCDRPAPLLGNQVQLRIACSNLLINGLEALEAMPPAQRRILVRLERGAGTSLSLLVADSGAGLQGRSLRSLTLASSKSEGMGLGLFTTALIAEQHRGSLAGGASPELGGAAMRLVLPCLPQPLVSSATSRSDAETRPVPVQRR